MGAYIYGYSKLNLKIDLWEDGNVSAAEYLSTQIETAAKDENGTLDEIFKKNSDNGGYHNWTTFLKDRLKKNNDIDYKYKDIYSDSMYDIKHIDVHNTFKVLCYYKCIDPNSLVCIYCL